MKNRSVKNILLFVIISMVGAKTYATILISKNSDGVNIHYNYINDGKELEVTHGSYEKVILSSEEVVTYKNKTLKVTSISGDAFKYCSGLTSVTIPNSVITIGYHAFYRCDSLTSIKVKEGNTVYDSRDNCNGIILTAENKLIHGCKNTVIPNSVTTIGAEVFAECYGLASITIPNSVILIDNCAFAECHGLTSITIPNSVKTIGVSAFAGCYRLTSVTIGNNVTSIGDWAFNSCTSLTSVTIPNSVTSIGDCAFQNCPSLTSLTIGNSVTSIGICAFTQCSSLISVISLKDNPFRISGKSSPSRIFDFDIFNNITLYVPVGTIDRYKATEGWKDFLYIKEIDVSNIKNVSNENNKETDRFTIDGQRIIEPKKGVNIIKMSDGTTKKVLVK